jgi:hypothetical protein
MMEINIIGQQLAVVHNNTIGSAMGHAHNAFSSLSTMVELSLKGQHKRSLT